MIEFIIGLLIGRAMVQRPKTTKELEQDACSHEWRYSKSYFECVECSKCAKVEDGVWHVGGKIGAMA